MRLGIVGLGAAGMSAALAGAEAGFEVVGFEQFGLDNQEASSGGRAKIIRFGYDDPFYADLMRSTLSRWEALEKRTGAHLMDLHGGLHLGSPDAIDIVQRGIVDAGRRAERLDAASDQLAAFGMRMRAPAADATTSRTAVYEPGAGVMWTSAVRGALATAAIEAGATLRDHTRVEDLREVADGVAVRTANGVDVFDRVIVAGGPWAFRLAPGAAAAFAITRRFQLVFGTEEPIGDGRPRPWIDLDAPGYYGMVNVAPGVHLTGVHDLDREQLVANPDDRDDEVIKADTVANAEAYVRERFGVEPRTIEVRVCHYTSTASRDFVIDDCPGLRRVMLLSPCSGHGFKFSITMGFYAATLASGQPVPDRERFRLQFATMS
jgi:sarcosine oxidase